MEKSVQEKRKRRTKKEMNDRNRFDKIVEDLMSDGICINDISDKLTTLYERNMNRNKEEYVKRGKERGAKYVLDIVDGFDHEHYPVYVGQDYDLGTIRRQYDGVNMQKVWATFNIEYDETLDDDSVSEELFSEALAAESIPDSMKSKWESIPKVYNGITHEELYAYAKTVATKVEKNMLNEIAKLVQ